MALAARMINSSIGKVLPGTAVSRLTGGSERKRAKRNR